MSKGQIDSRVSSILIKLDKELATIGVNQINSTMLLKALLEEEESPIYNAIMAQIEDTRFFPELLQETYRYISDNEMEGDNITEITVTNQEGKSKRIFFDEDLEDVWKLVEIYIEEGGILAIKELTAIFVYAMPTNVINVLRTFGVDITELKKTCGINVRKEYDNPEEEKQNFKSFKIPEEFRGFVKNFNEVIQKSTCDILEREKECELIWQTLQKRTKRNAVLIGKPGVGKTSIVKKITHDIISGNCPNEFKNFTVLSLDITASVAGTVLRGQAEERYSALAAFLEE